MFQLSDTGPYITDSFVRLSLFTNSRDEVMGEESFNLIVQDLFNNPKARNPGKAYSGQVLYTTVHKKYQEEPSTQFTR